MCIHFFAMCVGPLSVGKWWSTVRAIPKQMLVIPEAEDEIVTFSNFPPQQISPAFGNYDLILVKGGTDVFFPAFSQLGLLVLVRLLPIISICYTIFTWSFF